MDECKPLTGGFFASAAASTASLDHFHVYHPSVDSAESWRDTAVQSSQQSAAAAAAGASAAAAAAVAAGAAVTEVAEAEEEEEEEGALEEDGHAPGLRGKGEHTDVGVAIVMTPALLVEPGTGPDGGGGGGGAEEVDAFGARGLTLGGRSPAGAYTRSR